MKLYPHNIYFKILIFLLFILFFFTNSSIFAEKSIYSFKNIHIENEDYESLKAKNDIIKETIKDNFNYLLHNLTIQKNDYEFIIKNFNSNDYLKNIVIQKEIVTEKKYIADIDIFFDEEKIINLYKKNKIVFSDTISPNFLLVSGYNFDGSNILWEKNSWNKNWNSLTNFNNQINIIIPNEKKINKILLSYYDIKNLNIINLNKILNYYNLDHLIILRAKKIYNSDNSKIYIDLNITLYESKNASLKNIYSKEINIENLDKKNLLEDLTLFSYNKIFEWWKNETITYFDTKNNIICTFISSDIYEIQKIKNQLLSISQIDQIKLYSLNINDIAFDLSFFGNMNELINILKLSNLSLKYDSNDCYLSYESI